MQSLTDHSYSNYYIGNGRNIPVSVKHDILDADHRSSNQLGVFAQLISASIRMRDII